MNIFFIKLLALGGYGLYPTHLAPLMPKVVAELYCILTKCLDNENKTIFCLIKGYNEVTYLSYENLLSVIMMMVEQFLARQSQLWISLSVSDLHAKC